MQSKRILIIEDTPQNIELLVELIGGDYELLVATDGSTAMELLEHEQPDLILLDIMMPGMDGFEVCRKIKIQPQLQGIPIIFLTAKNDSDDIIKGFQAGAVDYVTKPFNLEELRARITTHLEIQEGREIILQQKREQKELIHVLCHDLQNPLSNLYSFCKLLEEGETKLETCLPHMLQSSWQGIQVIDLVRKLSALGEKSLSLQETNLHYALADCQSMLYNKLKEKEITLDIQGEGEPVQAEPISLVNSVLNNLLTNAIKFSWPGSRIEVRLFKEGGKQHIGIQDHGMGMPQKLVGQLFDVTAKTNREGTNNELGTGFGMPLVQRFMHAYGGDIKVTSKEQREGEKDHGTYVDLSFS